MVNDGGHMADHDGFFYKPSTVEPYVSLQWFSDTVVSEILPSENQTIQASLVKGESVSNTPYSLPPYISYEAQPLPINHMETMYGFENWAAQWTELDASFVITGDSNRPNKVAGEQFENDMGFYISQVNEDCDRGVHYMGNIEMSSNLVTDCGNGMLMPMSQPTSGTEYCQDFPSTLIDRSYVGQNGDITSTVSTFGKGIHTGLYFDIGSTIGLSMSQTTKDIVAGVGKGINTGLYFDIGSSIGLSMSQTTKDLVAGINCSNIVNECGNFNSIPSQPTCGTTQTDHFVDRVNGQTTGCSTQTDHSFDRANGNIKSTVCTDQTDHSFDRVNGNIKSTVCTDQTDHSFDGVKGNIRSSGSRFRKGINTGVSKARSNKKVDSRRLPGVYAAAMEALARPVSSYSLLYEQPSCLTSETPSKTKVDRQSGIKSKMEAQSESKLEKGLVKKGKPKGQLTNVKGLTGTGMLDGVTVHYVSPSGKLPGIIKGSNYLCGCISCKYSEEVNAYEFEHHAGRKTSHPNNHIQFKTGKTIFQIVQELKRTPENMVLDVIQTYIGSPINQEAFLAWKEKFQTGHLVMHEKEQID